MIIKRLLLLTILSGLWVSSICWAQSDNFLDTRDGNQYKLVKIGDQVWMANNLNYFIKEGSWCYENKDSNCTVFGRLYNWETAQKACPEGFHLPSDAEWQKLELAIGINEFETQIIGSHGNNQAEFLKSGGNSGFDILFAGYRLWWDGSFHYSGKYADFWTSTDSDAEEAWLRSFSINDNSIYRNLQNKKYANSVRCLKD